MDSYRESAWIVLDRAQSQKTWVRKPESPARTPRPRSTPTALRHGYRPGLRHHPRMLGLKIGTDADRC